MPRNLKIGLILIFSLFLILAIPGLGFGEENTDPPADKCAGVDCTASTTCADGFVASCTGVCDSATGECSACTPDCSGHETVDLCSGVSCPSVDKTCPDGFVATCTGTCDTNTGDCGTCEPDCTGHEAVTDKCAGVTCSPTETVCTDGTKVSCDNYCDSTTGECSSCTPPSCPGDVAPTCPEVTKPTCKADERVKEYKDENGCLFYKCETIAPICPAVMPTKPPCEDGRIEPIYDESGCLKAYKCVLEKPPEDCTPLPDPPRCPNGEEVRIDDTNIYGEVCAYHCEKVAGPVCPPSKPCPDEPDAACYWKFDEGKYCFCEECGDEKERIPEGCHQEKDEFGNLHLVCQEYEPPAEEKCSTNQNENPELKKCYDRGGYAEWDQRDPTYCTWFCKGEKQYVENGEKDCYDDQGNKMPCMSIPFKRKARCLTEEEVQKKKKDCKEMGMETVFKHEDGCNFPECRGKERFKCEDWKVSGDERKRQEKECGEWGVVKHFDEFGCPFFGCGGGQVEIVVPGVCKDEECKDKCFETKENAEKCLDTLKDRRDIPPEALHFLKKYIETGWKPTEEDWKRLEQPEKDHCIRLPKEAFERCRREGGELVAKDDERGCVVWHECVMRGNKDDIYFEERVERVPDAVDLLDIAFKLEELKMEFDKLVRKTDAIADYYASVNSPEEGRFRRVADMFEAAKDKVNEIGRNLKDRAKDLTVDDIMNTKHDIKYIKEVILKDIAFYMLSSGEEVKAITRERKEEWEFCGPEDKRQFKMCQEKGGFGQTDPHPRKDCEVYTHCEMHEERYRKAGEKEFEENLRICSPTPMGWKPDGDRGPTIKVIGLEGDNCILKVELPEGEGPPKQAVEAMGMKFPISMKCKVPGNLYPMGMMAMGHVFGMDQTSDEPNMESMKANCEGDMIKMMEMFGTGPPPGEQGRGPPRYEERQEFGGGPEEEPYYGRGPEESPFERCVAEGLSKEQCKRIAEGG